MKKLEVEKILHEKLTCENVKTNEILWKKLHVKREQRHYMCEMYCMKTHM